MDRTKIFKMLGEGMTQVEVAEKLGCSQANISQAIRSVKFCPNCGHTLN